MTDYKQFLRVTEDGFIWWLLKDAIRLAAGYRPYSDEGQTSEPELRATSGRALANERTLIGAFGDGRLNIEKPITFERDGFRYVDAEGFLDWLSQYIAQTQAKIAFPNDLVQAVRIASAKAAASRGPAADQPFSSLVLALEAWFAQPLAELPDDVRHRVEKSFLIPWDKLTSDGRRSVASQWDYQHDPATQDERQFWWDFFERQTDIEKQIEKWEAVSTPTASDLALKEARLRELRQEFDQMENQKRRARGDDYPERRHLDANEGASPTEPNPDIRYIAYPKAIKLLADRLGATPEELAAWVWMGPTDGGLAAYLNANELDPPPRFYFTLGNAGDFDYLSPLMACWFKEDNVANFEPADRFITGKALIERWSGQPGLQPEAFIRAKIAESRLLDGHPICGGTQGTNPGDAMFPPLESGLFVLAHVEKIEAEDFGVHLVSKPTEPSHPAIGTPEWRSHTAKVAADTRHSQPGGSRERKERIRTIWAAGKYTSRDRCAEEECAALDMSFAAARKALKNTPDPG